MRHEIIKTESYLLVLDYKDVQPGDSFLLNFDHPSGRIRRCHRVCDDGKEDLLMIDPVGFGFSYRRECKRISAHLPLNGAPYLEGVDRLPPIDNGDDVEILVPFPGGNEYRDGKEIGVWMEGWIEGHEEGYNKAREKYKFTEEDARQLIMYSFLKGVDRGHYSKEIEDRIIQTIQQPKLPVAFDCEIEYVHDDTVPYPKTLGTQPKTIINAEGRTEWVGKYIYE